MSVFHNTGWIVGVVEIVSRCDRQRRAELSLVWKAPTSVSIPPLHIAAHHSTSIAHAHCAMLSRPMRRQGLPQQDMAVTVNQQSIELSRFAVQVPSGPFCEFRKRPSCFRAVHTKRNTRKNNGTGTFQFVATKALERAFRKVRFHFLFGTPCFMVSQISKSILTFLTVHGVAHSREAR